MKNTIKELANLIQQGKNVLITEEGWKAIVHSHGEVTEEAAIEEQAG